MSLELSPLEVYAIRQAQIEAEEAAAKPKRVLSKAELDAIAAHFGFVALDQLCPKCHLMRVTIADTGEWFCGDCGEYGAGPAAFVRDERQAIAEEIREGYSWSALAVWVPILLSAVATLLAVVWAIVRWLR